MQNAKTPSITQIVAAGFNAMLARPWALLISLALDVYLWLGVQLTPQTLATEVHGLLSGLGQPELAADQAQGLAEAQLLVDQLRGTDLQLVAPLSFVPSLFAAGQPGRVPQLVLDPGSWPTTLLLVAGINLLALGLSALYLTLVARAVGRGADATDFVRASVARIWWGLLRYVLLVGGIGLLLGLPFLLLSLGLALLAPPLGSMLMLLWAGLLVALWFYAGLGVQAIAYGGAGPLQAAHQSVNIVRRNFLASLGLVVLSWVIVQGFLVIWQGLGSTLPGTIVALAGSAALGAGLSAARMIFYRDRLHRLKAEKAATAPA